MGFAPACCYWPQKEKTRPIYFSLSHHLKYRVGDNPISCWRQSEIMRWIVCSVCKILAPLKEFLHRDSMYECEVLPIQGIVNCKLESKTVT